MVDFMLSLNVVFPMFVYMAAGFCIRKAGLFSEEGFRKLGAFNFRCFIPLILFYSIYNADLEDIFQHDVLIFSVVMILIIFFVAWALCMRLIKDRRNAVSIAQCIFHSNYVLFGLAIAGTLCKGNGLATVSALAAVIVPVFNILAVILFSVTLKEKVHVGKLILDIFRNTLVDAGIIGVIFNLCGIHNLPQIIDTPISVLGTMATPVALIALGGIITFDSLRDHRHHLTLTVIIKLVIVPAIALIFAVLFGFRDDLLIVILAIFAAPTDVGSTPLANMLEGNSKLTGEIVASTSIFSLITIFLFTLVLSRFGFI
ncbi:MAG: AEC family transporter [Lachnospiraceae bacterium]|nr:AEC family transporter [Lachnospiraceae bacterium]